MTLARSDFNDPADPVTKAFVICDTSGGASIELFTGGGKVVDVWLQRPMLEKLAKAIDAAIADRGALVTAPDLRVAREGEWLR